MSFRRCLALVVAAMDLPFGYTLTIWSSGALAINRYGAPRVVEIFAFLLGAIGTYVVVASVVVADLGPVTPVRVRRSTLFNVFSIAAAIVVSGTTGLIDNAIAGYFVASLAGTLVYLFALATYNWLTTRTRSGPSEPSRSRN